MELWIFKEINQDGTFIRGVFDSEEKAEEMKEIYRERYQDWYEYGGFVHIIIKTTLNEEIREDVEQIV